MLYMSASSHLCSRATKEATLSALLCLTTQDKKKMAADEKPRHETAAEGNKRRHPKRQNGLTVLDASQRQK